MKVLSPENTIGDYLAAREKFGFGGFPVTENGALHSKLVGIVCSRDVDFLRDESLKLGDIMTKDLGA